MASLLGVRGTPTTRSAAAARRQLLPAAVAATPPSKASAIVRSANATQRREVVVVAATPSSAVVAASPPSTAGIITRSATAARRREAEVEARTCVSDLGRYIEFLREEEERLVEHAKSLTATVATAHADAERGIMRSMCSPAASRGIVWSGSGCSSWQASLNVQKRQAPYCIYPARR